MTTLFAQLQTLLTATPLLWQSEDPDGYPVEAVRFTGTDWQKGYEVLPDAHGLIFAQEGHKALVKLLNAGRLRHKLTAYRKPTGNPCEYELLILVRTGLCLNVYTGLKTYAIQS